jgi:hypothetical protein
MSVLNRTEYEAMQAAEYMEGAQMVNVPYDEENALADVRRQRRSEQSLLLDFEHGAIEAHVDGDGSIGVAAEPSPSAVQIGI